MSPHDNDLPEKPQPASADLLNSLQDWLTQDPNELIERRFVPGDREKGLPGRYVDVPVGSLPTAAP